jgi:hypothetical protein
MITVSNNPTNHMRRTMQKPFPFAREDQNPQYQHDALSAAGFARIFEDRVSGAEFSRAGLDQALAVLESGGVLVVWKLDRLGRSMLDTVKIVLDLDRRGVGFLSLTESFDTKSPMGRGVLRCWRRWQRMNGNGCGNAPRRAWRRRVVAGGMWAVRRNSRRNRLIMPGA